MLWDLPIASLLQRFVGGFLGELWVPALSPDTGDAAGKPLPSVLVPGQREVCLAASSCSASLPSIHAIDRDPSRWFQVLCGDLLALGKDTASSRQAVGMRLLPLPSLLAVTCPQLQLSVSCTPEDLG